MAFYFFIKRLKFAVFFPYNSSVAKREKENLKEAKKSSERFFDLHPDTKKSILAVLFLGLALILFLSGFEKAGPAGHYLYKSLGYLFGWGYFIFPVILLLIAFIFLSSSRQNLVGVTFLGGTFLILAALGLIDLLDKGRGGLLGNVVGALKIPFGFWAALVIILSIFAASLLIILNAPLKINLKFKKDKDRKAIEPIVVSGVSDEEIKSTAEKPEKETEIEIVSGSSKLVEPLKKEKITISQPRKFKGYVLPPLSLLDSQTAKPTSGDIKANANIIKRTLDSFGIPVEMSEITVGPTITRYTLKPAEGIKLSRITALHQDLALALAAHPIRIEAPIPGKSLIGIEVPNKSAALVRLHSLLSLEEFRSKSLSFTLGRDVSGVPFYPDISKMPHLLIAGATGSGKSMAIHSLIISLLYKNSPETLRLILIDPKRVELSVYDDLPHLVAPVVTETKQAMGVFRWATKEMERRYGILLANRVRDIESYNEKAFKKDEAPLPYLLIVVDELADLMTTYGREVEGLVIRLAQMARATGLHLIVSTQRPSVEIVTGLIKANITSRIALAVASQIDSRTILDIGGAEKLLGNGDMLYFSPEFSKPRRLQGSYVTDEEIKKVVNFIKENSQIPIEELLPLETEESSPNFSLFEDQNEDDPLYEAALETVMEADKASASLLQRRLKIGYARAARLLDIMEGKGIIGPGEGAKPREILIKKTEL